VNGSFSLNYYDVVYSHSWMRFDGEGTQRRGIIGSIGFRQHLDLPPGGISHELKRDYGWGLWNTALETRFLFPYDADRGWRRSRAVLRARTELECVVGRHRPGEQCRFEATPSISFPGFGGMGFAVRYASGWDYYNVGYTRSIRKHWSFGFIVDRAPGVALSRHALARAIFGR
jgi:hypothetical protein